MTDNILNNTITQLNQLNQLNLNQQCPIMEEYILAYQKHKQNASECIKYNDHQTISSDFLKSIHDNIHTMSDNELYENYNNIITPEYVKNELMVYELKYYTPEKQFNLSKIDVINIVTNILYQYKNCSYGYLLEDEIWSIHDISSNKYPLKPNEILFENSISVVNGNNDNDSHIDDIQYYIRLLRKHLNKILEFEIFDRVIEDQHNEICWILLICTYKKFE